MRNPILIFLFVFVIQVKITAQQTATYTNDLVAFNNAVALYNNQQYLAAQTEFSTIKEKNVSQAIKGDCAYYIANCAVRLNQQNAEMLLESFVEDYPISVKRNDAFLNVANFYFENGKYAHAQKWYDKVEMASLDASTAEMYNFNIGYAYFKSKRFNEAKKYFNRVTTSQEYGAQAKYYLGFIAYEGDQYEEANALFEEVKEEDRYAKGMSYYQADMNFKLGNFQKAIDLGLAQFENTPPKEKSELSKIIGESYFNLGQYQEAIPYLSAYKGKNGKWNNTDYYLIGYAYYKQKQYENAIGEFNKIIDGKNAVSQNAYYHLAHSYLETDKKQQALNAFKNASEMSFNNDIQEDAWFNYAKLSYEIGNSYSSVPQVLVSYLEAYPESDHNEMVNDLLIDSYISSNNYKEALLLLENNASFSNKLAYQKVAFLYGVELFTESNYQEAFQLFKKSLKEPRDPIYTARATYWKAECEYQLGNFSEALLGFKQYAQLVQANNTPEFTARKYALAYTHFKLKEYEAAIVNFEAFISENKDETRITDAYLRLGDCYFVTSKYWPAMENYNQVITRSQGNNDYAAFQKAISYGFVDRTESKLEGLQAFIKQYPNSIYKDDAQYELGNTYVSQNKSSNAIEAYTTLITTQPQSSFVPKAQLKKALLLDNAGNTNEALSLFKKVARDYPASPEALQAVASAKIIYIDQGRVDEYGNWVSTLEFVSVEDSELDDAAYQAAEQPYLENKLKQALTRFKSYLKDFPNGNHALKAHFYAAQIYFADKDFNNAKTEYEFVVKLERNEFTEQALARLSQIYLEEKAYQNALPILKRLENEADFPQNIIFAQTNSMKSLYEVGNFEEAVIYADKVIENPKVDTKIKSDAQLIIARSAMKTNDDAKAEVAYAEVAKIATGILAAEAMYYDAYFKHKKEEFEASNEVIQTLAKKYSGYKTFGAKGLVLMAQNFYALKDAYQATYILESVIQNFESFPDIVEEAKTLLAQIKETESKTNASVEKDEN